MSKIILSKLNKIELFILQEYCKYSVPKVYAKNYAYFDKHNFSYSKINKFVSDLKKLCKTEQEKALQNGDLQRADDIANFRKAFLYDKRSHVRLELDKNGYLNLAKTFMNALFPNPWSEWVIKDCILVAARMQYLFVSSGDEFMFVMP